jgi:nucleoside-diphosphate-sugar epimerase
MVTTATSFPRPRSALGYDAPLRNFIELNLTSGTVLRIAADIVAVWIAYLIDWVLVLGRDLTVPTTRESQWLILMVGAYSALAFIGPAGIGLYSRARRYNLVTKIRLVGVINITLFVIASTSLWLVGQLDGFTFRVLLAVFAGSTILQSLARVFADVLRTEEVRTHDDVTDENKVLVIGGAGYIGSALVEMLLKMGRRVSIFDAMHFGEDSLRPILGHPNLELIREDFRHIEALTRAMGGVGSVVHLGGLVGDPACAVDTELTVDVNVTATKVIGEIAKARGVRRFIFASSCSVYGACDDIVHEDSHFHPQSLYARSKVASEAVLGSLNDNNFSVTCLRFATIYGISGRTRFDLVVNLLCAKAVRDRLITVYGADQWRPFVHVEDVARAIVLTLDAPIELVAGEAFNVGSDTQNYTLGRVAELIKEQIPDAEIVSDDTFVDRRNYRVSFKKIQSRLGFEPLWTVENGIAQVTALVRSNRVGHYSEPTYSNVLFLKEYGTTGFSSFKITGWENEFMNLTRIASLRAASQSAA